MVGMLVSGHDGGAPDFVGVVAVGGEAEDVSEAEAVLEKVLVHDAVPGGRTDELGAVEVEEVLDARPAVLQVHGADEEDGEHDVGGDDGEHGDLASDLDAAVEDLVDGGPDEEGAADEFPVEVAVEALVSGRRWRGRSRSSESSG